MVEVVHRRHSLCEICLTDSLVIFITVLKHHLTCVRLSNRVVHLILIQAIIRPRNFIYWQLSNSPLLPLSTCPKIKGVHRLFPQLRKKKLSALFNHLTANLVRFCLVSYVTQIQSAYFIPIQSKFMRFDLAIRCCHNI